MPRLTRITRILHPVCQPLLKGVITAQRSRLDESRHYVYRVSKLQNSAGGFLAQDQREIRLNEIRFRKIGFKLLVDESQNDRLEGVNDSSQDYEDALSDYWDAVDALEDYEDALEHYEDGVED